MLLVMEILLMKLLYRILKPKAGEYIASEDVLELTLDSNEGLNKN